MSKFSDVSDRQLIRQTVGGDVESFNSLVERYHGMVYNLAYRMLGNTNDAQDATQETFLESFKSIRGFKFQSAFKTWLYRIALNTCQQHLRRSDSRKRTMYSYTEDTKNIQRSTTGPTQPDQHLLKTEKEQIIQLAIGSLPTKQKTVVTLFYMQHLKYREIAEVLGCSEGTVASRLNTAISNLKNLLGRRL